jgi:hypothetical protein
VRPIPGGIVIVNRAAKHTFVHLRCQPWPCLLAYHTGLSRTFLFGNTSFFFSCFFSASVVTRSKKHSRVEAVGQQRTTRSMVTLQSSADSRFERHSSVLTNSRMHTNFCSNQAQDPRPQVVLSISTPTAGWHRICASEGSIQRSLVSAGQRRPAVGIPRYHPAQRPHPEASA